MFKDVVEIISLFATSPTVLLAIFVLTIWGRQAISVSTKVDKTPMDWLLLGVCLSFLGAVVDNMYWGFVWSVDYVTGHLPSILCQIGVLINCFFRQGIGSLAAFCHLEAYYRTKESQKPLKNVVITSIILGFIYVIILYILKV